MLAPVAYSKAAAGQDARVALKRAEGKLDEANKRLVTSRGIYARVRKTYGGQR